MDEKQLLQAMQTMIDHAKEELQQDIRGVAMVQENHMQRIENLLKEDYGRLAKSAADTADYNDIKDIQASHGQAIKNHEERIEKLEKSAAV